MRMQVVPFEFCGPVSCLDTYLSIKSKFPDQHEFKKTYLCKHVTSSILSSYAHVYFHEDGRCKGVEIFKEVDLVYEAMHLFKAPLRVLVEQLNGKKISSSVTDCGISVDSIGISTYTDDFVESLDCYADSIYVTFERAANPKV